LKQKKEAISESENAGEGTNSENADNKEADEAGHEATPAENRDKPSEVKGKNQ